MGSSGFVTEDGFVIDTNELVNQRTDTNETPRRYQEPDTPADGRKRISHKISVGRACCRVQSSFYSSSEQADACSASRCICHGWTYAVMTRELLIRTISASITRMGTSIYHELKKAA